MAEQSFLEYINYYTTVSADHEAAFDEYLATTRYQPARGKLRLSTKIEAFVKEKFMDKNSRPPSVILTGNAGDGKTYLCRQIIEQFTKEPLTEWSDNIDWNLHEGALTLSVIKDLSELDEAKGAKMLQHLADSYSAGQEGSVFLIAANEGRLRKLLSGSSKLENIAEVIDKQLESGPDINNTQLIVLNLNKVSTSSYVLELLDWLTHEENWRDSPCSNPERCPIHHNLKQMRLPYVQNQIVKLYKILEHLGIHLTIRDILIHLVYVLTTGKRCRDFQDEGLESYRFSYYQNFFGEASSKLQREKITAIHHLRNIDVGRISRYTIDNFIINGAAETQDSNDAHAYQQCFAPAFDLAERRFLQDRDKYLQGQHSLSKKNEQPAFLPWLPHCRRKLFFEWDDARCSTLLPFDHLADYFTMLEDPNLIERYLPRIILGLNRVFTGLLLDDDQYLYLSSQYTHSSIRSLPLLRLKLPQDNIQICVESNDSDAYNQDNPRLVLEIYPPPRVRAETIHWHLHLLNFEYLLRRADGGMPNILGAECALEVRQLKDTLLVNFMDKGKQHTKDVEFISLKETGYNTQKIKLAEEKLYI